MHYIAMQFASGRAFFVGVLLVAWVALLGCRRARPLGPLLTIAAVVGAVLVLLSATPLPPAAYGVWLLLVAGCIVLSEKQQTRGLRVHTVTVTLLVSVSLGLVATEVPYRFSRPLPFPLDKPVIVVGDSLAMALETGVEPWPHQWGKSVGLEVTNFAAGGKRVGGTAEDARRIALTDASVLIEIGGNDELAAVSARQFGQDLEALLRVVCTPGRAVAMFELPLIPFYNRYGIAQRRSAREYGVTLIPKARLASILADPSATVDGLHLTAEGHRRLADVLTSLTPKGRTPAAGQTATR